MAGLAIEFASRTETGPVRPQNEDSLGWGRIGASGDGGALYAVADGLGAYGGGDIASKLAIETLLGHAIARAGNDARVPNLLRSGFNKANQGVFDAALDGEHGQKMQTTLVALALSPGEAHIGHVGDCRVYRLRRNSLDLLTTDHSQVMEMLRMRMITQEQAIDHPARHALTRSLGSELIVRTDVRKEALSAGDAFLLCSDGLWGKVQAGEIQSALASDDLEHAVSHLVDLSVERGGEDNATGLAVRVVAPGEAPEAKPSRWKRLFLS